ncbi:hypothetical protein JX265_012573 [Neoarthrinium moseri]|uniref:Uncharacterized protein n=1 Tax=Neoarthrinium moseri TaxID=1658444 RepID=A0A9P9WA73_9PEZI|nr:hypothetical protein JX266_011194 [Neoarthrinium moseri]KAI1853888.1 hypothetical protein JX265_012573 [Neoarthrinium moseri]
MLSTQRGTIHVVGLQDKTAIVTECARQLLDLKLTKLILAVRDEQKGQHACARLSSGRRLDDGAIEVRKLDLQSYDSTTAFAERAKTLPRLNIAILNAGIMKQKHELSPLTKHEETIQLNVLSNTLLSVLLLPSPKRKARNNESGRLAVVSSDVSSWAQFKEKNDSPLLTSMSVTQISL